MRPWLIGFVMLFLLSAPLRGGDMPIVMAAKLLVMISKGAGENGRIATKHPEMSAEIVKQGGTVDLAGRVAWATDPGEVRLFNMQRKCTVVNNPTYLGQGASIALYEDGGKAKLAINQRGILASGVQLSDQIIKAALAQ